MKQLFYIMIFIVSIPSHALSSWLEKLEEKDKQEQLDLRWVASGGEMDIQFIHNKLNIMKIKLSPKPQFPNKPWDQNHMVFPIHPKSSMSLQVPYGSIEKVTDSNLQAKTRFSLAYGKKRIKIKSLKFFHNPRKNKDLDIVTFKLFDQKGRHLFNTNNVHIQYSKDRKLLQMKHMDISASKELALLLDMPELTHQLLGQVSTYSYLKIPNNAQFNLKGSACFENLQDVVNYSNFTDIQLVGMPTYNNSEPINWLGNINGTNKMILVPSAELFNVGTADVSWHPKFSGNYEPYDTDQHPYLVWSVYREIDNRFEQIGLSGLKHAFYATNYNCSCSGGFILGIGCGDIYGKASNDLSNALGPRSELESFTGIWQSCGSFFDPNCDGIEDGGSGSTSTGENRLTIDPAGIVPNLIMSAWYVVRDDIDIFNSMGYKIFNPELINDTWVMNTEATFYSGPAIYNYVPSNTLQAMQASQTITTTEGHFIVAVKVTDIGNGLYRYNYAIENLDFDPSFSQFNIPMIFPLKLANPVFSDSDKDVANNWIFNSSNGELKLIGNPSNKQDWGMLFSFSFTIPAPPKQGSLSIDVTEPLLNNTVSSLTLIPDLSGFVFIDSFE